MFQVTNHESPKIWDIFERFQNFAKRKVLRRTSSFLVESCDEEANVSQSSTNGYSSIKFDIETEQPAENLDESWTGGDRKRRRVDLPDCEDGLENHGEVKPQPATAFTPKCLNFDEVDE